MVLIRVVLKWTAFSWGDLSSGVPRSWTWLLTEKIKKYEKIISPIKFHEFTSCTLVGRSENLGVHNLPPLVEIGLTDLPKSGGAMAHGRPD